uniref:BRO1 domain-containing protein n=1 Tax=Romanomermis culicivorax TaxID=13658 RepID=A0A915KDA5_ROMCU
MKISCTHFQCAAYAFQTLKDSPTLCSSQFSTDFDSSILNWNFNLMMAQAQECILEKSIVDRRKCSIVAKIAAQVAEFYKECLKNLSNVNLTDIVDGSRCKTWKKFIEAKQKYYWAVAYFYNGLQYEPSDENVKDLGQNIGERIAYYQAAMENLSSANSFAKDSQQIRDPLQFVESIVSTKLESAKKDNDFVFHERIPNLADLPELKGASLVKPIPFDPLDVEISGPDIFQKLIPLSVHQSSSLYSEEKANLLRRVSSQVEEKNQILNDYLLSLQLGNLNLDANSDEISLPEKLLECCAAFNAMPDAVPQLLSSMNEISTVYRKVESILIEFNQQLNDAESDLGVFDKTNDEKAEKLKINLHDLKIQFKRFSEANNLATQSNTELHKAMAEHSDNLKLLSAPLNELKKQLFECAPKIDYNCPESLELKKISAKIDEMKEQRRNLLDDLRLQIMNDDITKLLLANRQQDCRELFDKQLAKHEKSVKILEQNLAAQDNILKLLTDANARCGDFRRAMVESSVAREEKVQQLVDSFNAYLDLKDKSAQGVSFYDRLQSNLKDFNEKLNKYGLEFNKFETEMAKKQTKVVPENVDEGPKLKDYMAYYQAMKSGQQPTFAPKTLGGGGFTNVYPGVILAPRQPSSNVNYANYQLPSSSYNQNFVAQSPYSSVAQPRQTYVASQQPPPTNFGQLYGQQQNFSAQTPFPQNPYAPRPTAAAPYVPQAYSTPYPPQNLAASTPGHPSALGYNWPPMTQPATVYAASFQSPQFGNSPAQRPTQNLMDQPVEAVALPPPMAPGAQ